MGPIDYSIDVQSPFQAALQGYQAGAAIRDDQLKQQQQANALELQKQMQADIGAVYRNPNAGARDYAALTMKYPALKDQFKQSWDMVGKEQQAGKLDLMTRAYSALSTGRADIAEKLMRDTAEAMRNSGASERDVQSQEMWANLIKQSPEQARHLGGLMLSSIMDPDKFGSTFQTLGDQGRAADKAPAELARAEAEAAIKGVEAANAPTAAGLANANIRSQIAERADRLKLDRDKLTSDMELELYKLKQTQTNLDGEAKKLLNDSTLASLAADQSATATINLADQFDKLGGGNGVLGTTAEAWAKIAGDQDAMSRARAEYTRLRNSQAIKNLPQGSASDADVKMALEGFPPETADSKYLSQFLRGMGKLQQLDAAAQKAKAEWVNAVGHLGKPKADIEVDGIKVPAGSSFVDFSNQFIQKKADERSAAKATQAVQGRGYMRFAKPAASAPAAAPGAVDITGVLPATGGL